MAQPNRLTADDMAIGFVNARSALAARHDGYRRPARTLAAAFVIIGDLLSHSGVSETELVRLARQSAHIDLEAAH